MDPRTRGLGTLYVIPDDIFSERILAQLSDLVFIHFEFFNKRHVTAKYHFKRKILLFH